MSQRIWISVIGLAVVGLLVFIAIDSARSVGRAFPGFLAWDNGVLVAMHRTSWTGPKAALPLNGGRIVAVDQAPFETGVALRRHAFARGPDARITYRIASGESDVEYQVPTMRLSWGDYLGTFGNYLGNSGLFLAIGLVAWYLRPDLLAARALAASMIFTGLLMALAVDYLGSYRFVRLCQTVEACTPAVIAYFALVFPVEWVGRRSRRFLLAGFAFVSALLAVANASLFYSDPDAARLVTTAIYLLLAISMLGLLVSLAAGLVRAASPVDRIRAAIVFSGAMAAFVVPAIGFVAFFLLGWTISFSWITALLFVFPLSLLYAVIRHDFLDAERFIRLTVGYTFATSSIVLVYALVSVGFGRLLGPASTESPALAFGMLIAIALLFDPIRRRAQLFVDRVFFRSPVDPGHILEEIGLELAEAGDEAGVALAVGASLREELFLEWAQLETGPHEPDGATLVVPLVFRGERLGAIRCGPKRSGAPFGSGDEELVRGIAAQAALALRNVRSIQELRRAQATLLRTERLAVIGEFAGSVAHGIRNPLAGIRAAAQIAAERTRDTDGDVAEALSSVIRESDRLDLRIRTLLDFSRPFDPKSRPCDLAAVVDDVLKALRPHAKLEGVTLEASVPDGITLRTDPDYLEEALLELSGNALRASGNGGTLRISATVDAGLVTLRVADTGGGIPAPVQDRIFDLFFTTRPDGTGLGLASVKKIIERLGGEVRLESSDAGGSVFQIQLAAVEPTQRDIQA